MWPIASLLREPWTAAPEPPEAPPPPVPGTVRLAESVRERVSELKSSSTLLLEERIERPSANEPMGERPSPPAKEAVGERPSFEPPPLRSG